MKNVQKECNQNDCYYFLNKICETTYGRNGIVPYPRCYRCSSRGACKKGSICRAINMDTTSCCFELNDNNSSRKAF